MSLVSTLSFAIWNFQMTNDHKSVRCYNGCGRKMGVIASSPEKDALLYMMMEEDVVFQAFSGKQVNDLKIPISVTGYTWTDKQALIKRLQSKTIKHIGFL